LVLVLGLLLVLGLGLALHFSGIPVADKHPGEGARFHVDLGECYARTTAPSRSAQRLASEIRPASRLAACEEESVERLLARNCEGVSLVMRLKRRQKYETSPYPQLAATSFKVVE